MKEPNSIVERKWKLGRVVLNKNPLEKSDRREVAAAHGRSAGLVDFLCPYAGPIGSVSPRQGFPGGSEGKESACSAGDLDSIPGSGRSLGEGNGNPLQNSCLENPINRGTW